MSQNKYLDWWRSSTVLTKSLVAIGTLSVVALGTVMVVQFGTLADTRTELQASEARADSAATDLAETEEQLASAEQEIAELENTIAELDTKISGLEGTTSELEAQLAQAQGELESKEALSSEELEAAEDALREAESAKEQAEVALAELMLAYSDEIASARSRIAESLSAFACGWGTSLAARGEPIDAVRPESVVTAYENSDQFRELASDPGVQPALRIAEALDEDPYPVSSEEIRTAATGCWQVEDERINAALYIHEDVIRESVIEATCTLGIDEVYEGYVPGYEDTAAFAEWELEIGAGEANDYIDEIEARFGSVRAFLAIPEAELQAEDDRCAERRSLISPKGGGTWNVGQEIMPGVWNAFDVSDCYWARLASNGDIRDNHFGDALRISVNVLSSDGQFEISGCRFYYANP